MKSFEFNYQQQRWDTYSAFHTNAPPFVEFATGELMLARVPDADQRKRYQRYGIQLVATTDRDCPQLYLDKACTQPVLSAWITQGGMQDLAVDEEQKVAIKCSGWYRDEKTVAEANLPKHLVSAKVLWTGPGRLPTSYQKINVSVPDKAAAKELGGKLRDVRAAITAISRVRGLSKAWNSDKMNAKTLWADQSVEEIVENICKHDTDIRLAATNGFTHPRRGTEHEFLYIK